MRRAVKGLIYDTETATEICQLPCEFQSSRDFGHHTTSLYRTPKGRYFLAGEGGALSLWGRHFENGSKHAGEGVRPLTMEEARQYAEDAEVSPEAMIAAGFAVEDA